MRSMTKLDVDKLALEASRAADANCASDACSLMLTH